MFDSCEKLSIFSAQNYFYFVYLIIRCDYLTHFVNNFNKKTCILNIIFATNVNYSVQSVIQLLSLAITYEWKRKWKIWWWNGLDPQIYHIENVNTHSSGLYWRTLFFLPSTSLCQSSYIISLVDYRFTTPRGSGHLFYTLIWFCRLLYAVTTD